MAGIYVHIPFCKQACTYCNFHFSTSLVNKDAFLVALLREIQQTSFFEKAGGNIETVYFGGGTPSLLQAEEIDSILHALHTRFNIDANAEITLEANPDDISPSKLALWKQTGINRLSLGVQSFAEDELQWMNRAHHAAESLQSIDDIISAGFQNFSTDLIYGSHLPGNEHFEKDLEVIFSKSIPHISCYALTVEPNTALHHQVKLRRTSAPDPGKQAAQFELLMKRMKEEGYEHYEISNFAKPGMRSRHNSSYWQGKPYYGFGPSAHSFNGEHTRRWNVANNPAYIRNWQEGTPVFEEEHLTPTQQMNEYIMISLRTAEGVSLEYIQEKWGQPAVTELHIRAKRYLESKRLKQEEGTLLLTDEGKLFADGIAADLFS